MIRVRKSEDRGHVKGDWLESWHSFSFADYYDPNFMGFSKLRVINEDRIMGQTGFGMHPHQNMEIITYVISGSLEHEDNMGNGSLIGPSDTQYMSAGTGVMHSETNPDTEEVHLLQIWIIPKVKSEKPLYAQKHFPREQKLNRMCLLASEDGAENSLLIRQDAKLFASILGKNQSLVYGLKPQRSAWVQVVKGSMLVNGTQLDPGDGAGVLPDSLDTLEFTSREECEFLLFDLL